MCWIAEVPRTWLSSASCTVMHHLVSLLFGLCKVRLTLFFFPICLLSLTSDRTQIDVKGITSVWNVLPFSNPFNFFLRFRIHRCWFPLNSLLLHLLRQKLHAILLILKFVAVVQCSSHLHLCSPSLTTLCSPCTSISLFTLRLLLADSFWHMCSCPVLNLQWMPQPRF